LTITVINYTQEGHYDSYEIIFLRGYPMAKKPGDVLTIEELAAYLKIPKSTLYKLVREGRIPSQKIGRHWRFRKGAIDNWLEEKRADNPSLGGNRND
jgi:excisionase family DNA binding protein